MVTAGMAAGMAILLLVFLALLCTCFRKGKQTRSKESTPLDNPAYFNNERRDYCEVRPSVKSLPDKTAGAGTDQSEDTGPAMVVSNEETVHSDVKTAEVKTPKANHKVLSNGPVYTLVDMDKKALDREEKANNARNRGNEYVSDDDRAYATIELGDDFGDKVGETEGKVPNSSSIKLAPRSSSTKKDNSGVQMDQYEQMEISDKDITNIHKTPEGHTKNDEQGVFGSSLNEPYDVLQLGSKSSVSSDLSKGDNQTKGQSSDDSVLAYHSMVIGPCSSGVSSRPDSYPLGDYETVTVSPPVSPEASASMMPDSYPLSDYEIVSPPMSPEVAAIGHKLSPSSDNKTIGSLDAGPGEQLHRPLDTSDMTRQQQTPDKRDSNMSHTYEDPVAMTSELERPYDILQRGPDPRKQTATSLTASKVDEKAKEEADHDDALNVYNEITTQDVGLKESEEGSEAYQHLQRPLSKRPKAGASLPEIPDEGYGRLDLEGSGASNQTVPVTHRAQDSQGPKTTPSDPVYATLDNPAEANVPDVDDPEYDLSEAFM
eukprot:XP_011682577.1 PREDICTED: uncharacterized protein LOC105446888 [Strongylocentrotus purpuratus]